MAGYNLQPFDGKTDFSMWQQKMKGILIQQKVFKSIDGNYVENVSDDKRDNDEYAYSSIILNLSDSVIRKVGKQNTAKELWDRLEELFTETSLPSKLILLEKNFRYKLDMSKNIEENIDEFTKQVQDIKLTGDKNIDDYTPIVLLNAIPDVYSDVKAAIKYGRDNVRLDTVINGLKSKEMDIKTNKTSQSNNEVNMVRGRTKNRNSDYKYRRHSKGRSRSRSRSRSKSRSRDDRNKDDKTKERRCYNCGIKGHYIKDCRKPKRDNRENHYKEDTNVVTENTGDVFMKFSLLLNLENLVLVSMANQKRCEIQGLGDVCLTFSDGYKLTLTNVRYVPDLNHNLISCAALEEEGLEGRWGKGIMKIMKGSLTVFKAVRKRNLLGHISQKGLELLQKEGVLSDKIEKLKFCDECVMGKQHKVQFPASQNPNPVSSSCILDYVHADVWGPSNIPTHGGNKKWKILVENQTGKKLKVLRTDNGLEFCNQSFSNLCDECGIKRHKTNPYTPQQNGVVERMNRTILEKVRCMIISSGLPKSFWGEALVTAAYLINRSPSVPLNGKIPEFVWTSHAVDISSLRVFGCSVFVHQSVDKLAPRSQKCVCIGYPDGIKGYRLWLRSQPGFKVLISKDVIFNENEMPCLDNSQDKKHANLDITFNKVEDNQQGKKVKKNLVLNFLKTLILKV
ncbi:Retrovirus-related Pol polyprotein from transposon TNT 1-94 [Sesamum angolense]|uniref:Retrovirus-related Pol polyprotein from transposon TNT 1-94 n=1 Tax=Sesamum angolense TaxID=2727404 RepID=A0AAE1XE27_9LAMI|nr:Retrovirus-related Pol polyprotein from transposon TNT 1-94 [Sesamum angolense]